MTRIVLFLFTLLFLLPSAKAQLIQDPTTWTYEVQKAGDDKYNLIFRLNLTEGWHIWSMTPGGDGYQIAPSFEFERSTFYKASGDVNESGAHKHTGPMEGVEGNVTYYDGEVQYMQTVFAKGGAIIKGTHEYQVCNDQMCLPPKRRAFVFKIES